MFEHILVPTDGSDDSWIALDQAVEIAREEGSTIHGLFVADVRVLEAPFQTAMSSGVSALDIDPALTQLAIEVGKRLSEWGDGVLIQFNQRCQQAGVPYQTEYTEGVVSRTILDRARQTDLVVMGRHGEGSRWAGPLLGSTFEAVVRHAPVPVLATHVEARPTTSLLVAFDGSDRARDGLDIAARWAARRNLSIVLLTVDDGHRGRQQAYQLAEGLLRKQNLAVTSLFWKGHPAEEILRAAQVEECDVIVIGAYGHSRFLETLFGSTVDEIVHGATRPVLVCR